MKFSPITSQDIDALIPLQPADWKDIRVVFRMHHGRNYFSAFKGVIDDQMIVVGHIIYCGEVAWLGNIIVHPSHRKRGYAKLMTTFLMNEIRLTGISNIYLLATEMGYPVYEKLGFTLFNHYIFNSIVSLDKTSTYISMVRKCVDSDLPAILKLDFETMGYDRSYILKFHINDAWVYESKSIKGFFMPNLGDGLIIAKDEHSGWALSKIRVEMGKDYLVIPEEQQTTIRILYLENGFQLNPTGRIAYFMYQGRTPQIKSPMIYSRIGGYLG
ncbi:MAG: GNAT family N-acetyltransferase [Saprospiraceae bacterium]|nr:GNAT family N-acetyltransferase [Saprospiraceae bacterium]